MPDVCEFHKDMIAKSTVKWIATVFAIPTIGAILTAWGFVASADYRYGSSLQAQSNAANIKLLDERTLSLKQEILRMQADISADLTTIKSDLKEISRDMKLRSSERLK